MNFRQQFTSKACHWPIMVVIGEDSTCFAGEVFDAPLAPCAPGRAHSKVRDGEGIGVHPLHECIPVLTVAQHQSAAPPLNQDFCKPVGIHDPWRRDCHLWIVTIWLKFQKYLRSTHCNNDGHDNATLPCQASVCST